MGTKIKRKHQQEAQINEVTCIWWMSTICCTALSC